MVHKVWDIMYHILRILKSMLAIMQQPQKHTNTEYMSEFLTQTLLKLGC